MKIRKFLKLVSSKKYLLKHPVYVILSGILYFFDFKIKVQFYSDDEIIKNLEQGKSIIRFGDGDMVNIMLGMENIYHRYDPILEKMYLEIVNEYTPESRYIFSVPRFITFSNKELTTLGGGVKLNWGIRMKSMFILYFNNNCKYMDAHNFYYDNYFKAIVAPVLNGKKIICVTNKRVIESQIKNNNIPWENIKYIESPESDAMDSYDRILSELDKELSLCDKKNVVILYAMGPVGKYIIFKYSKLGYQGIDIGRGLEVIYKNDSLEDIYPEIRMNKTKSW